MIVDRLNITALFIIQAEASVINFDSLLLLLQMTKSSEYSRRTGRETSALTAKAMSERENYGIKSLIKRDQLLQRTS